MVLVWIMVIISSVGPNGMRSPQEAKWAKAVPPPLVEYVLVAVYFRMTHVKLVSYMVLVRSVSLRDVQLHKLVKVAVRGVDRRRIAPRSLIHHWLLPFCSQFTVIDTRTLHHPRIYQCHCYHEYPTNSSDVSTVQVTRERWMLSKKQSISTLPNGSWQDMERSWYGSCSWLLDNTEKPLGVLACCQIEGVCSKVVDPSKHLNAASAGECLPVLAASSLSDTANTLHNSEQC